MYGGIATIIKSMHVTVTMVILSITTDILSIITTDILNMAGLVILAVITINIIEIMVFYLTQTITFHQDFTSGSKQIRPPHLTQKCPGLSSAI